MNKLRLTATLLLIALPTQSFAKTTCQEAFQACDKVVQDQKKQIQIRDLRIKQDEDQLKNVTDERNSAERALGAWYRSPWLYVAIGLGAGLYLGRR